MAIFMLIQIRTNYVIFEILHPPCISTETFQSDIIILSLLSPQRNNLEPSNQGIGYFGNNLFEQEQSDHIK